MVPSNQPLPLLIPFGAVLVLLILAATGNSAVMAVSAVGIAAALWITHGSRLSTRLRGVAIGALGGSLLAETVHTVYHLLGGETASGDSGFFFVSAFLVGGVNAVAVMLTVWLGHVVGRLRDRSTVVDPHRSKRP